MAEGFTPNDSNGSGNGGGGFTPNDGSSNIPKEMTNPGGLFAEGGNLSQETLEKYKSSAKDMRAAAERGMAGDTSGFAVSENLGNAHIKAWTNFQNNLQKIRENVEIAATPVSLGGDEFAQAISKHAAESARGGEDSFEAAIDALEIIAEEAIAAFEAAKKGYAAMEEAGAETFTSKDLFGE